MEFAIRPYQPADRHTVASLWFESWESTGVMAPGTSGTVAELAERLPLKIARGQEVHVVTLAGDVVGFCALDGEELKQLFVAPPCQGRGVGKRLLDFVKRERPSGFTLTTAMNSRAPKFYEREGMTRVGTEPHPTHGFPMYRYDWTLA